MHAPRMAHAPAAVVVDVPRLENGDRLTVAEFLRRYEAMPEVKKAELVEGRVYVSSPVSCDHSEPDALVVAWLAYYRAYTPGTGVYANGTVILDDGENCLQPDGCLRILPERGGRSRTSVQRYVSGPVELAAEVTLSSASYDLHDKLGAYERNGVAEYLVWRVDDAALDWFRLRGKAYRPLPRRDGTIQSKVFPGLWLDVAALLAGDMARVLKTLDRGLASDEHARFVARLSKRRG